MKKSLALVLAAAAAALSAVNVAGAASISVALGTHHLLPNTPNQQLPLYVTGDGVAVLGINFNVQVADGYDTAIPLGVIDGPNITGLDILTGTLFAPNNTGPSGADVVLEQFAFASTTTLSGSIPVTSSPTLLATITVDTTGWSAGEWDFSITGTVNGDTEFLTFDATQPGNLGHIVPLTTAGRLVIDETPAVPVPASAFTGGALLAGLAIARRIRQGATA